MLSGILNSPSMFHHTLKLRVAEGIFQSDSETIYRKIIKKTIKNFKMWCLLTQHFCSDIKQLQRTVNSWKKYKTLFLIDLHFHLRFIYFYLLTPENLSIIPGLSTCLYILKICLLLKRYKFTSAASQ